MFHPEDIKKMQKSADYLRKICNSESIELEKPKWNNSNVSAYRKAKRYPSGIDANVPDCNWRKSVKEYTDSRSISLPEFLLRPRNRFVKHILAHGTNLFTVFSSMVLSNAQLIPGNKMKKLGITATTGESRATTGLNKRYVSGFALRGWNNKLPGAICYAKMAANYFQPITLDNKDPDNKDFNYIYYILSEIPAIIIGDGEENTEINVMGLTDEVGCKRINIRFIIVWPHYVNITLLVLNALDNQNSRNIGVVNIEEIRDVWNEETLRKLARFNLNLPFHSAFRDRILRFWVPMNPNPQHY